MEKENIFCGGYEARRRKRKKIFEEGKNFFCRGEEIEKEQEENIGRRNFFLRRRKRKKIFGEGQNIC